MTELKLLLHDAAQQTPPEQKPLLFILTDSRIRHGGFFAGTYFSNGEKYRPQEVEAWAEVPHRVQFPG